jgi:membrane protease YdiL (CAAX protease family)
MHFTALQDKLKSVVARLPRRVTLLIVLVVAVLAIALWLCLDLLTTAANLSTSGQLAAFAGLAVFLLTLGLGGLAFFFRRQPSLPESPLMSSIMLGLVVLPSFTIATTFALVAHTIIRPTQSLLAELLVQPEASLWRPWVFFWQVLVLIFALRITPSSPIITSDRSQTSVWKRAWYWIDRDLTTNRSLVAGLLSGLALWLVYVFIQSMAASFSNPWLDLGESAVPTLATPLLIILAVVALTLAPWAEEVFFRGLLFEHWQTKLSPVLTNLGAAAIFAFLPMRPLLWVPAFLLGIGLGFLRQRSGLSAAILAHILFNSLMLVLNPLLVI